jgi:23S rRNA pseudouridine2457 synthase
MPTLKFWKPYHVLTQFTDDKGRATLADYIDVPDVYAAGRLDYDSEGLLLLTDDGQLNHLLTQPKYGHPRTYLAQVERIPDDDALNKLRQGVKVKKYTTRPAMVMLLQDEPDLPPRPEPIRYRKNVPTAWLELILTEGKNRQVRRMTAAVGHPTLRLVRSAVGPVRLDDLKPGEWKKLTAIEMKALKASIRDSRR